MCKRRGCPFQRKDGHFTWHLFCCNACKRGGDAEQVPEIYHTEDCTGEESSTMALASEQSSMMAFQYGVVPLRRPSLYTNFPMAKTSVRIPPSWACTDNNIVDFIGYWYFWATTMHENVETAWRKLEAFTIRTCRPLKIYVCAQDRFPNQEFYNAIDVDVRGLDARHPNDEYLCEHVTGIDMAVQDVLLQLQGTAEVIFDACEKIEAYDIESFVFVSSHATHRSVGCAVLLAMIAYHCAQIVFTTKRTIEAAYSHGMIVKAL
jgi:hypothetical protein